MDGEEEERIELTLNFGRSSSLPNRCCCSCSCCHHQHTRKGKDGDNDCDDEREERAFMTITQFSNGDGSDGSATRFHDLTGPSTKKQHFDPHKKVFPMFTADYDDDGEDGEDQEQCDSKKRGRSDDAEDEQARALAARDYLEKGGLLAEQGMFSEAISQWILGISANPPPFEASRLWESRAQAHMALEEWFLAVQCAEFATQKDPSWADGFVTLGRAQLNLGEPSMAVESIQRALTIGLENKADEEEAKQDLCYAKEQAAKAKAMRDALPPERRDCILVREGQKIE